MNESSAFGLSEPILLLESIIKFFRTPAGRLVGMGITFLLFVYILARLLVYLKRRFRMAMSRLESSGVSQAVRMMQEAAEKQKVQQEEQPKSLNSMERIYGPKIAKEYPDLRLDVLANEAENLLVDSYKALEHGISPEFREEAGEIYTQALERMISLHNGLGTNAASFSQLRVHDRALSMYGYREGKKSIEFQFAVEAYISTQNQSPIKRQMKNTIRYQFTDDVKLFTDKEGKTVILGRNCPNCGAPVAANHGGHCSYCGSGLAQLATRDWLPTELFAEYWVEGFYL